MGRAVSLEAEMDAGGPAVWRAIYRMSWPTIVGGWLKSSYALADTFYAGRLSVDALAALSAAVFFVWIFHSLSLTNSIGTLSVIARAKGAGDDDAMRAAFRRSLLLALLLGGGMSALFVVAVPIVVPWLGLSAAVASDAVDYLLVIGAAGCGLWFFDTIEQAFRGTGDARTPLVVSVVFAVLNVGLNPLFAFGLGPLPGMGLVGIGLASGLAWLGGGLTLVVIAWRRGLLKPASAEAPRAWSVWRVGMPNAASGVSFDLIWITLAPLVALSGPAALAAVAIGHRLESISYLMSTGIGPDLARQVAQRSALAGFVLSALWLGGVLFFGEPLVGLFTDDGEVITYGLDYLACSAVPAVFQAVEVVVLGAFAGTGRTLLPSALQLFTYAARIPLSRAFAPRFGAAGVFGAIGLTATAAGIVISTTFWLVGARSRAPSKAGARSAMEGG
jgi:Na+-driven multidrug efflux pump